MLSKIKYAIYNMSFLFCSNKIYVNVISDRERDTEREIFMMIFRVLY